MGEQRFKLGDATPEQVLGALAAKKEDVGEHEKKRNPWVGMSQDNRQKIPMEEWLSRGYAKRETEEEKEEVPSLIDFIGRRKKWGTAAKIFWRFVRAKLEAKGNRITTPLVGKEGIVEVEGKEARDILRNQANEAIDALVTHGLMRKKADGNWHLDGNSDLDGKACLYLCKLAGLKAKPHYVEPGESTAGAMNMDTSGREGVVFDPETTTIYIDHHDPETSPTGTSAAEYVYETLWRAGLIDLDNLEEATALEGAIAFVTAIDNGDYPGMDDPEVFLRLGKTMLGLVWYLNFPEVVRFFEKFDDPVDLLSDEEIKKKWPRGGGVSLLDRSKAIMDRVEKSIGVVAQLNEEGFSLDSPKLGKILVDIASAGEKRVPMGKEAASALGFDTYVIWNPDEESFAVNSRYKLEVELGQGFGVRERMWLKPRGDGVKLTVTLGEILEKLMGGEVAARDKLAEYLDKEAGTKAFWEALAKEEEDQRVLAEEAFWRTLGE